MEKILLFFALKYNGNWDAIYKALDRKETIDFSQLENIEHKIKCKYLTILNPLYPQYLKSIYKPPFVLFYYGDISDLNYCHNVLAVSGTEHPDEYGLVKTREFVKNFILNHKTILTGLNKGIEAETVQTVLDNNGKVVIICNNGIDEVSKDFEKLYHRLKDNNQLIISEYAYKVVQEKNVIRSRNRIISGLSKAIIIPQCEKNAWVMNIVSFASNDGKEVFCLPERIGKMNGTNLLIKQGAKLIETVDDVLEEI